MFTVGQVVLADYDCADEAGGSGLATCAGPVADGAPIDTSLGTHTFTVNATDVAGNPGGATATYLVLGDLGGSMLPAPAWNDATAGSSLTVSFDLRALIELIRTHGRPHHGGLGGHGHVVLSALFDYPMTQRVDCGDPTRSIGPAQRADRRPQREPRRPPPPGLEVGEAVGGDLSCARVAVRRARRAAQVPREIPLTFPGSRSGRSSRRSGPTVARSERVRAWNHLPVHQRSIPSSVAVPADRSRDRRGSASLGAREPRPALYGDEPYYVFDAAAYLGGAIVEPIGADPPGRQDRRRGHVGPPTAGQVDHRAARGRPDRSALDRMAAPVGGVRDRRRRHSSTSWPSASGDRSGGRASPRSCWRSTACTSSRAGWRCSTSSSRRSSPPAVLFLVLDRERMDVTRTAGRWPPDRAALRLAVPLVGGRLPRVRGRHEMVGRVRAGRSSAGLCAIWAFTGRPARRSLGASRPLGTLVTLVRRRAPRRLPR